MKAKPPVPTLAARQHFASAAGNVRLRTKLVATERQQADCGPHGPGNPANVGLSTVRAKWPKGCACRKRRAGIQIDDPPNSGEQFAVEKFLTRRPLKIAAFAGAGKTTTLKILAEATPSRGAYLAFNKAIAAEAKEKFPIISNALSLRIGKRCCR